MKETVKNHLIAIFCGIGMDMPDNIESIAEFCMNDIKETADKEDWHSGDVAIAFRRWIEQNNMPPQAEFDGHVNDKAKEIISHLQTCNGVCKGRCYFAGTKGQLWEVNGVNIVLMLTNTGYELFGPVIAGNMQEQKDFIKYVKRTQQG